MSTPTTIRTDLRKRLPTQTAADAPECAPPAYKQLAVTQVRYAGW